MAPFTPNQGSANSRHASIPHTLVYRYTVKEPFRPVYLIITYCCGPYALPPQRPQKLYILLSLVTYSKNAEQLVLDKDHFYGAYVGGVRAVFWHSLPEVNVSTLTHVFGDPPSMHMPCPDTYLHLGSSKVPPFES
jgi:hypothetical protein